MSTFEAALNQAAPDTAAEKFRIETKIDQISKKAGAFPKSGLIFRSFFLAAFVSFV
jgi:hypothetical protein